MTSSFPISDLHCDLLCYLANDPQRSAFDRDVRCSIPQLLKGSVKFQVLPIFTETLNNSSRLGSKQAEIFCQLPKIYPGKFEFNNTTFDIDEDDNGSIKIMLAIENASSFADEAEPFEDCLTRLESYQNAAGNILYISLTWNTENRFGGGASTSIGLKPDGKLLLNYLHEKKIAVDLSHASDLLAFEILNYIDANNLDLSVIASHSNLREVTNAPRNLPDELALEILKRKGLIGINFVRYFVGSETPQNFIKQLERFLMLGGEKQVCFGADFFYGGDVSAAFYKPPEILFFPEYGDSSVYPKVLDLWKQHLGLGNDTLQNIANKNLKQFLKTVFYSK